MIETTYQYIKDHCDWGKACCVLGWNPYMFNEGFSNADVSITFDQAKKIGLSIVLKGKAND